MLEQVLHTVLSHRFSLSSYHKLETLKLVYVYDYTTAPLLISLTPVCTET